MQTKHGPPGNLKKIVARFIDEGNADPSQLMSNIESSQLSEIAEAFSFLAMRMREQSDLRSSVPNISKYNVCNALMLYLHRFLPPQYLQSVLYERSMDFNDPYGALGYMRFFHSMTILSASSSLAKLIPYMSSIPFSVPLIVDSILPDQSISPELEPSLITFLKRLLLSHTPIEHFQPFFKIKASRTLLTNSIISLIDELNNCRIATHDQLVIQFSHLFLYINAFESSNGIDSQLLADYLISQPFLSPFCILAMVNHIPSTLNIFNLLIPPEVSYCQSPPNPFNPQQFQIADMSSQKRLAEFVENIPTILSNYLLSTSSQSSSDTFDKMDDINMFTFVHISGVPMYSKMKAILSAARDRVLGPVHVATMGVVMLKCIAYSLQRTFGDCANSAIFTTNFRLFTRTVIAFLTASFDQQMEARFFDISRLEPNEIDLNVRGSVFYVLPYFLTHNNNEALFDCCIKLMKFAYPHHSPTTILTKILLCGNPRITEKVAEALNETGDLSALSEFADAMTGFCCCQTFKEKRMVSELRNSIIKRLGYEVIEAPFLVVDSAVLPNDLLSYAVPLYEFFNQLTKENAAEETKKALRRDDLTTFSILRTAYFSKFIAEKSVAEVICECLTDLMMRKEDSSSPNFTFHLAEGDLALPISQLLLERLVYFGFDDLAISLFKVMQVKLKADFIPLHWISNFIVKYRHLISKQIKKLMIEFIETLHMSNELYGQEDIAGLLSSIEGNLLQNVDSIVCEYQSPYLHAQAFCVCTLLLSEKSDEEIADELTLPIKRFDEVFRNREARAMCLAKLAANLTTDIGMCYYSKLLEICDFDPSVPAGTLFLLSSSIDVLEKVIAEIPKLANNDMGKLAYLIHTLQPALIRAKECEDVGLNFVAGVLRSVKDNTPEKTQAYIIDVIANTIYRFNLIGSREAIISSAKGIKPEFIAILSRCFEKL